MNQGSIQMVAMLYAVSRKQENLSVERFSSYLEMRQRIGVLFAQKKYKQAIDILEWGLKAYPEQITANIFNLALCQVHLPAPKEAIQTLQYGLDQEIWFGPCEISLDAWDSIKGLHAFQEIQSRYEDLRAKAQRDAKPKMEVMLPESSDRGKKSPLFIALHGPGETAQDSISKWRSSKLASQFIAVYPQSSRVVSMRGYSWRGERSDLQEIVNAYEAVLKDYRVDPDRVILGAYSSAGSLVLNLLFARQEIFPFCGYVLLCPPVPQEYPLAAIKRVWNRGQRGVLLTAELDKRLIEQEKMAMIFDSAGIPLKFKVLTRVGRGYPPDLDVRIDEAIDFILSSKED
jgi:predicted esterase